mmetsp:Transcript_54208/g.117159  ORF Transcript_54208/g.117159 Transcript_54208/m.117159 type:complete len:267 (+) Transcript_54208:1142-1942(+)
MLCCTLRCAGAPRDGAAGAWPGLPEALPESGGLASPSSRLAPLELALASADRAPSKVSEASLKAAALAACNAESTPCGCSLARTACAWDTASADETTAAPDAALAPLGTLLPRLRGLFVAGSSPTPLASERSRQSLPAGSSMRGARAASSAERVPGEQPAQDGLTPASPSFSKGDSSTSTTSPSRSTSINGETGSNEKPSMAKRICPWGASARRLRRNCLRSATVSRLDGRATTMRRVPSTSTLSLVARASCGAKPAAELLSGDIT